MISSVGFVHDGPCACTHDSHWFAQYSILIYIYIYYYIYLFIPLFITRFVTNVHRRIYFSYIKDILNLY